MQPEQTDLAITAVEPILGTLNSDIDMSKEYFKYEGDCGKACTSYDFRYETKAFYANVVMQLINVGLYGPADIQQIANALVEDYKKI